MKKVRFIFLALLFFLASPEGAMASDGTLARKTVSERRWQSSSE
ncbi:Uncharacterised protein [Streptococcus pneumoniae]|nr:Uncharacterised protein [Streptococcus pneumoniae]